MPARWWRPFGHVQAPMLVFWPMAVEVTTAACQVLLRRLLLEVRSRCTAAQHLMRRGRPAG